MFVDHIFQQRRASRRNFRTKGRRMIRRSFCINTYVSTKFFFKSIQIDDNKSYFFSRTFGEEPLTKQRCLYKYTAFRQLRTEFHHRRWNRMKTDKLKYMLNCGDIKNWDEPLATVATLYRVGEQVRSACTTTNTWLKLDVITRGSNVQSPSTNTTTTMSLPMCRLRCSCWGLASENGSMWHTWNITSKSRYCVYTLYSPVLREKKLCYWNETREGTVGTCRFSHQDRRDIYQSLLVALVRPTHRGTRCRQAMLRYSSRCPPINTKFNVF